MAWQSPVQRTSEYWWVWAVSGIVTIIFGLLAIFWPGLTLLVLLYLFGFYAIVDGAVALVAMFKASGAGQTWWPYLILGIVGIGAGLIALFWPGITTLILLMVIAIWAIIAGIAMVVGGLFQLQFLAMIAGVVSILFGLVLFANPVAGALALVWVIGVFAVVRGVLQVIEAIRTASGPAVAA